MAERRYFRPISPPRGSRRSANPARSSTGSLGYPMFDPYYQTSRIGRDVRTSPRTSAEGFFDDRRTSSRVHPVDRSSSGHSYGAYQRPRRPTLEPEADGRLPLVTPTSPRPVIHSQVVEIPRDLVTSTAEPDAEYGYYISPGTSPRRLHHHRDSSVEERNINRLGRRAEPVDGDPIRASRPGPAYREYGRGERRRGYHYDGPPVTEYRVDQDGVYYYGDYGYGPSSYAPSSVTPYREPNTRRRRAESLDTSRRERPLSMMELQEYLPHVPASRERGGPPPSTRGFDHLARGAVGGYGDPRLPLEEPVYELPREGGSHAARRRPVSLHQDDHRHGLRHHEAIPQDREPEHAHPGRSRQDKVDRRMMYQVTDDGRHRHGTRDHSPDGGLSEGDERTDRRHHHRRRRHHQEEDLLESSRAGEVPDRTLIERDPRDRRPYPPAPEQRGESSQPDGARDHKASRSDYSERRSDDAGRKESWPDKKAPNDDEVPSQRRPERIGVVSPPRDKEVKVPLKSILREPRPKFPEDPAPVREGVAPLKEALKDGKKGIPPNARWTKIDRRRVNPEALEEARERFEVRPDHVIVLRVLTRDEIEVLAARTKQIRGEKHIYTLALYIAWRRARTCPGDSRD